MNANTHFPAIDELTIEQKVGQVLCLGWQADAGGSADSINDHARALVQDLFAGAIVLLGRNISTPEGTRRVIEEMQGMSGVPLLVAIDQEGGSVNRIGPPFHQFPGNMALGAMARGSGIEAAEDLSTG